MRLKLQLHTVKHLRLFLAFITYTDITAELFLPYTLREVSHSEYALKFLFRYSCILKKDVFFRNSFKIYGKDVLRKDSQKPVLTAGRYAKLNYLRCSADLLRGE